jgi:hypothetical protein
MALLQHEIRARHFSPRFDMARRMIGASTLAGRVLAGPARPFLQSERWETNNV